LGEQPRKERINIIESLLGLAACCGLFYVFTIAGANEGHPLILITAFGVCFFVFRLFKYFLDYFPEGKIAPKNWQSKLLGPSFIAIIFGPVLSWGLLVAVEPREDSVKLMLLLCGLVLTFVLASIWLNKKT